jgi:phthalate 4,5-cis-dihydrodiol dehydrogenase
MICGIMDQMPGKTLRLGVIGLGRAAALMLPSLLAHPHVRLTAAADPNPDARARFEADFGGRTYASAEELCAAPDVDAVYVATPHEYHAADVLTAARHGKHAIVEKPMALTLEECRAMTDAAERNGTVLVVGHSHGFDPAIMMIRDIVKRGDVGPLRMIVNLVYGDFLYRPRRPQELDTSLGGGIIYNQVPHQLDIVRTIDGGPLRSVYAMTGIWDRARPTEGAMTALLEFSDGVAASLTYNGYDHFDTDEFHDWVGEDGAPRTPAHGRRRAAIRAYETPADEIRGRTARGFAGSGVVRPAATMHDPHFGLLVVSCEHADLRPSPDGVLVYDDDGVRELPAPKARAYPNKDGVIDEFYDAIVGGVAPLHDGAWGTATMAAALALLQSARERRIVTLTAEDAAHVVR